MLTVNQINKQLLDCISDNLFISLADLNVKSNITYKDVPASSCLLSHQHGDTCRAEHEHSLDLPRVLQGMAEDHKIALLYVSGKKGGTYALSKEVNIAFEKNNIKLTSLNGTWVLETAPGDVINIVK